MKQVFFIAAVILAFIATFVALAGVSTDGRGRWLDINFFAGAFFCYLLSIAPFVGS